MNPGVNEILLACRENRLDYRSNPDSPDGPWRAQCPVCKTTSGLDELPLVITANGHIRCGHRCDPEQIARLLLNAPGPTAQPDETDWLTGAPMDPMGATTEPLPPLPGLPFAHAGAGIVIVGPTGGGRSSLIQAGLYGAGLEGLRCAYLGSEVTLGEFNARADMLAKARRDPVDDELRAELSRVRYLDLSSVMIRAWAAPEAWVAGITAAYDIVAIDPLSSVASALDLDFDRSNSDFIRFYDKLVQPLTTAGVTVPMLENIGHAVEAKGRAKGASAKSDRADLTFSCGRLTSPEAMSIKATKVRSIRAGIKYGDQWRFLRDTQTIEPWNADTAPEQTGRFRPTVLMERVSKAVIADPGLSKRAIRKTVRGKAEAVDLALDLLIAEHYIDPRVDGQTSKHYSIKAYTDETHTTDRVPVSQPCPDRVPDTGGVDRVPVSPLLRTRDTGHGSKDTPTDADRVPHLEVVA